MVATLPDCIAQGAHGYPPELRLALQPISRNEFEDGRVAASQFEILESLVSPFERLREAAQKGCEPTPPEMPQEYYFRLTQNGETPQTVTNVPRLIEICDASGDLAAPEEGVEPAPISTRVQFGAKLLSSDAIVFVLPLVRFEESPWVGSLSRLVERVALAADRKAQRIIVAGSCYERLFVNLGPCAFTYACDPRIAAHVLRRTLATAPWLDALRSLELKGVALRYCVFSSFGFVKGFQNPNLDPHQAGERPFLRASAKGRRAQGEFWRPFLSAEAVLSAALGVDSAFCFSHERLAAHPEPAEELE